MVLNQPIETPATPTAEQMPDFKASPNATPVAMILIDQNGQILMANATARILLEQVDDDLIGQNIEVFLPERLRAEGAEKLSSIFNLAKSHSDEKREAVILTEEGLEIPVEMSLRPIQDRTGVYLLISMFDHFNEFQAYNKLREENHSLSKIVSERGDKIKDLNDQLNEKMIMARKSDEDRLDLVLKLFMSQEQQKHRIARELHDQVGQHLLALKLGIQACEEKLEKGSPAIGSLEKFKELIDEIGRELRQIALELRPTSLEDLGLVTALLNYCEMWMQRTGIKINFHSSGFDNDRLPKEIETVIYRVIQESLTNIFKHTTAKNVSVALIKSLTQVLAMVEDDGQGFDTKKLTEEKFDQTHLGLIGMRERLLLAKGNLIVESKEGQGTCIVARIPLVSVKERVEL